MVISVLIVLLLLAAVACAADWDPYAELASPECWARPRPGESLMFSGTDPGGKNMDSGNFVRIEPAGASFMEGDWVLAEMEGPGAITRIWVTGKNRAGEGPNIVGQLHIYIDDRSTPAIDVPIEDFFGKTGPFAAPFAMPTSGGWISYLPIPFQSYCKVVVVDRQDRFAHRVNGLGETIPHFYHHITWRKLAAGTKVEPFSMELSQERKDLLAKAAAALERKPAAQDVETVEIAPGKTLEVLSADGPGMVEQITLVGDDLENLWLTAKWDGSDAYAVEAPARMFFSDGLEPREFSSLAMSFEGKTHSCRFPMPYEKGAVIALENRGSKPIVAGCAAKASAACDSPMRFRARYIDEHIEANAPDLVVLDTKNGPGQFVGMAMLLPKDFMEGNESFFVDGAKPGWVGTGTEDYFNGGWYFCLGPYDQPFSGCIHKGDYIAAYRWHLADAVTYQRSLKVGLEHGGVNEIAGHARGVAYWYEAGR